MTKLSHRILWNLPIATLAWNLLGVPAQSQFFSAAKLVATNAVASPDKDYPPHQGFSVSLSGDGNTAIVSAPWDWWGMKQGTFGDGAVWVWSYSNGSWGTATKLFAMDGPGATQGHAVALSGDGNTAIVGGPGDNLSAGVGAAWVWTRSGGVWTQQGSKLIGSGAAGSAEQGYAVAISYDGNTAIVGGPGDNNGTGAAWVWTRSGGVWTQQGSKLIGSGAAGSAGQGYSVALSDDGNTAIISGNQDNNGTGAAWVWTRSAGVWTQQGSKLIGSGAVGFALQGPVALSGDGNTALVGGNEDNNGTGAAWVWTRSGGVWTQQGSKLIGTGAAGSFSPGQGVSVALSGDGETAIVGGDFDGDGLGAAWVYTPCAPTWCQLGNKLAPTGSFTTAPYFGNSVALSRNGQTAIVGGFNDNNGTGAAWVYLRQEPPTPPGPPQLPLCFSSNEIWCARVGMCVPRSLCLIQPPTPPKGSPLP
jgi:hypothetical protein